MKKPFYQDEFGKIYCEDCFSLFKQLKNDSVDVVFTSPPYNRKRNDKYKFYNDIEKDYFLFLKTAIDESIRISKKYVFFNIMKNYYNKQDVFKIIGNYNSKICEIFIWEKTNPLPASGKSITNSYEFILCFGKDLKSNKTYTKNHLTTSVAKMFKEHKAVMHEDVAFFFINNFTSEQETVFDPFMGTGTTAKIAKQLNRKFLGSEISEKYCEIIKNKLSFQELIL